MAWKILPKHNENYINRYHEFDDVKNINWVFNNEINKEIVLCVGRVQSGKTSKIIKCIEHALCNLKYDIVILFAGTNNSLYKQTQDRIEEKKNPNFLYISKTELKYRKYIENKQYVISILKNPNDLENVDCFIYSIKNLKNKKILIIDDESDYASINISRKNKSEIYKKIRDLYKKIYNGKILQVTATPYANIISNKSDELKPNRIVCWSNHEKYYGINKFNENKEDIYKIVDTTKRDDSNHSEIINEIIKYYLSTIINNYKPIKNYLNMLDKNKREITCLLNIDDDTNTHEIIYRYVYQHLDNIKKRNKKQFYDEYINKSISYNEYEHLLEHIFMNEIGIVLFNNKGEWSLEEKRIFNIYIGGIKASRGFTFENLITELILNSPFKKISVDTLLQRCRWFGYREEIIDFTKIFMSNKIYNALIESIEYVNMLEPGNYDVNEIKNKIIELDKKMDFVCSTSKE